MKSENVKAEAIELIKSLPDHATWNDVMHKIYVRQAIEAGLRDSDAGRKIEVSLLRDKLGLKR